MRDYTYTLRENHSTQDCHNVTTEFSVKYKKHVSITMSTASTANAPAQTTVPSSWYQAHSDREVSVLSGRPMSAAKISLFLASRDVELHPSNKPHTIPNETDMDTINWSHFSHIEDNTSQAAAKTTGSVTTSDDVAPMALHEIFSKSATAATFWNGAETPAREEVSDLKRGIRALVARYNQGYQEGRFDPQEGRLITRDDSGRQTDIRVYIMNRLHMLETCFRLPNKIYPLDLIEFQDSAQMMRLPYYQAIHEALETRRRAVLSADGNCQSDAYINQALSDISYDIAGCGYDVSQVIGDDDNFEVWAMYKIPGDDHLHVASYAWRSSIRARSEQDSSSL